MTEVLPEINIRLTAKQKQVLLSPANEIFYGGAAGGGKAQSLRGVVYTPFGSRRVGDLKIGDAVCTPYGTTAKIIYLHPIVEQELYQLTFSDGSKACGSGEHLWRIWYSSRKKKQEKHTVPLFPSEDLRGFNATTLQVKEFVESGYHDVKIPVTHPVVFTKSYKYDCREIEPYLLGVLLGDGCITTKSLTLACDDPEIVDIIEARNPFKFSHTEGSICWRISVKSGIHAQLDRLKLLGTKSSTKFIPEWYKYAPIKDRWELIRGLMDTDGYADDRGRLQYVSVSEQLAKDVQWLAWSLGATCKITSKIGSYKTKGGSRIKCQKVYMLYIQSRNNADFFNLSRKKARCEGQLYNGGFSTIGRRVISVTPMGKELARCITIDHPSGLYLTDDFVVTHNSFLLRAAAIFYCSRIPYLQAYLVRRLSTDLKKNHVEGPTGFRALLEPWTRAFTPDGKPFAQIVDAEIRFWNHSKIFLAHCELEKDKYNFQGPEVHLFLPDELTHFSEGIYRFIRGRQRIGSLRPHLPPEYLHKFPLCIAASNPGNVGHEWVKRSFVDMCPGEAIVKVSKSEGGRLRQFIPATMRDNPYLEEEYGDTLEGLGSPELVKAMKDGDWNVLMGGMFPNFSRTRHMVAPFKIPVHWVRIMTLDWGFWYPFSVNWWALAAEEYDHPETKQHIPFGSLICYREWYGTQKPGSNLGIGMDPESVAKKILQMERSAEGPPDYRFADPEMWKSDTGVTTASLFSKTGVKLVQADNTHETGYVELQRRLAGNDGVPEIYWFDGVCSNSERNFTNAIRDEANPNEIHKSCEIHGIDSSRYASMAVRRGLRAASRREPVTIDTNLTYGHMIAAAEKWEREHNAEKGPLEC